MNEFGAKKKHFDKMTAVRLFFINKPFIYAHT